MMPKLALLVMEKIVGIQNTIGAEVPEERGVVQETIIIAALALLVPEERGKLAPKKITEIAQITSLKSETAPRYAGVYHLLHVRDLARGQGQGRNPPLDHRDRSKVWCVLS
jgi:hypothetical protein